MMLSQTTKCDHDRLQRLLDGELPEQAEAAVSQHVEKCDACRRELETLAAKEEWWRETRELLVGWPAPTEREPASRARPTDSPILISPPEALEQPSLAFLAPSDNPAMLGKLGEFEVLEFIGRGGMGIVLKGYDHELNRFVAIKVMGSHYAEHAAARRRFAREAQAAAAVVHQHVVAIHAVDATHQPPFFVMPFIPGESLQQRLDRTGPFEVAEVLRIGQQVAEGLAAAHAQGLVHRDVKPSNILLERNVERVLLTDFGLARAIDDVSQTQSGVIAGTPQYMSPEQARGEAIDHRSDLFSLGSVLYALLAGHGPFRADSPYTVLRRVNDDTPRSLREINSQVPLWLEAFIGRLLAKRLEDRWQSAQHVADLLKECLAHVQQPSSVALPTEISSLVHRSSKRAVRWSIAGVLVVILAGLVWFGSQKPVPKIDPAITPNSDETSRLIQTSDSPGKSQDPLDEWQDPLSTEVESASERLKVLEQEAEF